MTTEALCTTEAAARYHHPLRCAVVPLEPGGKRPVWQGWTEPRPLPEVLQYFETHPEANLGVLLGPASNELRCLDVDDRTAAVELFRSCPELKALPRVRTARGGHVYFRPSDPEAWPSAKVRFEGQPLGEVLAGGRQAVAPPSFVEGEPGPREWVGGWPVDFPLLVLHPEDLGLELLLSKHVTTANGEPPEADRRVPLDTLLQGALDRACEGTRNDCGLWLACQARDCGYTEAETALALRAYAFAVGKGKHPYTWQEAEATLRSAFTRHPREPWPEPLRLGRKAVQVDTEAEGEARSSSSTATPQLRFLSASEYVAKAPAEVDWLVRDFLPAGQLAILCGAAKAGKSRLSLQLAGSVARGEPFLGFQVESPGAVLVANVEEAPALLADRVTAFHLPDNVHLLEVDGSFSTKLVAPQALAELEAAIMSTEARLLVLDPLLDIAEFDGDSENAAGKVQAALRPLRALALRTGAAVLAIDHTGKIGSGPRGSSAKLGTARSIFELVSLAAEGGGELVRLSCVSNYYPPTELLLEPDGLALVPSDRKVSGAEGFDARLVAKVLEVLGPGVELCLSAIARRVGVDRNAVSALVKALAARENPPIELARGRGNKVLVRRVKRESEVPSDHYAKAGTL